MNIPVIDLHCDLLGCIEHNEKVLHFDSPETNCSIPQLLKGNVFIQTFAIATITRKGSTLSSERQIQLYKELLKQHSYDVKNQFKSPMDTQSLHSLISIENASGLAEESESLEKAFDRFIKFSKAGKILYVSLTWNHENRFGGGNDSNAGLKADGRSLLDFLSIYHVPIDLSHTSDRLAHDILDYIQRKSLPIVPIASHSNFRAMKDIRRNLPNEIAKEIFRLGGVIGINFIRRFVGDEKTDFIKHIQHGIELGGENSLCLGADFYGGVDIPLSLMPERSFPIFQNEFSNSSCYPQFFSFLQNTISQDIIEKIFYRNAFNLFKKIRIVE